jgi:hypothetical protein
MDCVKEARESLDRAAALTSMPIALTTYIDSGMYEKATTPRPQSNAL